MTANSTKSKLRYPLRSATKSKEEKPAAVESTNSSASRRYLSFNYLFTAIGVKFHVKILIVVGLLKLIPIHGFTTFKLNNSLNWLIFVDENFMWRYDDVPTIVIRGIN